MRRLIIFSVYFCKKYKGGVNRCLSLFGFPDHEQRGQCHNVASFFLYSTCLHTSICRFLYREAACWLRLLSLSKCHSSQQPFLSILADISPL